MRHQRMTRMIKHKKTSCPSKFNHQHGLKYQQISFDWRNSGSTMPALTFQSKVVIVTGCSSGIGLSTTLSFLSHGAKVLGIDVAPFDHTIPEELKPSLVFHQADLTQANAITDAITACKSNFGPRIDILINAAGVGDGFSSADTVTDGEWDRVISINLSVPVKLMRAVLPSMVEHQQGAIVNICSRASNSGATAGIAYTASKHGLVSLILMELRF